MQGADQAFRGKSGLQVSPIGPLIVREYQQFDPVRRQIVETDLQDRSQQARSNAAPGVSDCYSPEPDALMGASDTLQDSEACDVGSIACHQISGGRIFDFGGVLLGLPSADQRRVTLHALHTYDGRYVGFGCGLYLHAAVWRWHACRAMLERGVRPNPPGKRGSRSRAAQLRG